MDREGIRSIIRHSHSLNGTLLALKQSYRQPTSGSLEHYEKSVGSNHSQRSTNNSELDWLLLQQLIHQIRSFVHALQRFKDASGIDRDGTGDGVAVGVVEYQRLDVAIEDDANEFALAVDDGGAGVASDDVRRADEVERRVELHLVLGLVPAVGKHEGIAENRCQRYRSIKV